MAKKFNGHRCERRNLTDLVLGTGPDGKKRAKPKAKSRPKNFFEPGGPTGGEGGGQERGGGGEWDREGGRHHREGRGGEYPEPAAIEPARSYSGRAWHLRHAGLQPRHTVHRGSDDARHPGVPGHSAHQCYPRFRAAAVATATTSGYGVDNDALAITGRFITRI